MEWRQVAEAPEYQVSADGQIRSVYTRRHLKGGTDKVGYRKLVICTGGRRIHRRVAALVCEAFHGPRPPGAVVRHRDGSRDNDAAANLEWGTQAENIADKRRHGTHQRGSLHPRAKLDEVKVRHILTSGLPTAALAKLYGVKRVTIQAVLQRRNWSHVTV